MTLAGIGLSKRFGDLVVLDDVDFSVAPGEAVGIVGPERRRQDDAAQRARRSRTPERRAPSASTART